MSETAAYHSCSMSLGNFEMDSGLRVLFQRKETTYGSLKLFHIPQVNVRIKCSVHFPGLLRSCCVNSFISLARAY